MEKLTENFLSLFKDGSINDLASILEENYLKERSLLKEAMQKISSMVKLFNTPTPPTMLVAYSPDDVLNYSVCISTDPESIATYFGEENAFVYYEGIIASETRPNSRQASPGLLDGDKIIEETLNLPLNDSLVVTYIDDSVGYGLFTKEPINQGDIIGIYSGIVLNEKGETFINSQVISILEENIPKSKRVTDKIECFFKNNTYAHEREKSRDYLSGYDKINAGMVGGLARFVQHMPFHKNEVFSQIDGAKTSEELVEIAKIYAIYPTNPDDFELDEFKALIKEKVGEGFDQGFIDERTENLLTSPCGAKVATANAVVKTAAIINGVHVQVLMAARHIKAGEQLGYDYGLPYWQDRNKSPKLFDKETGLVYEPSSNKNQAKMGFFESDEDPVKRYNQGVVLFKEGKFNEAISVLKRSLELFKKCKNQEKEAICLSTIASCYRELGGLKRAIEYCSLAQKKDPTNKKIEEKLQGLKELQERGLPTLKI